MNLTISIDGVEFTLIRKTIYDDRYRDVVNVESLVIDDDEEKKYNFWVYRSNSELGLWRLCIDLRGKFHKGPDYIQSTLIHVELQKFINDNIDVIPFVSNLYGFMRSMTNASHTRRLLKIGGNTLQLRYA